ncbi:uncharacterized protein LOC144447684 [Glandiceps talaboti]
MEISQDQKALETLLHQLEDRLPETIFNYHLVRHIKDKKWDKTQVFVDGSMQDFTTLLCHGPHVMSKNSNIGGWYLYSDDEEKLISMLNKIRLTEHSLDGFCPQDTVLLLGVTDKYLKTITQYMMSNHGFVIEQKFTYRLYMTTLDKDTLASYKQQAYTLPKGYTIAPLRPEHASLVASKTAYCSPTAVPLVKKMIEEFPSFAIYAPNQDEPVSWSMLHENGSPGFGYTQPQYRNRKFAKIIGKEMVHCLSEYGYKMVPSETTDDNKIVHHNMKKHPGLTTLDLIHFITFKKTPQMPAPASKL